MCLREYVPDELAERTAFLWATLSRACHHHAYELSPNARRDQRVDRGCGGGRGRARGARLRFLARDVLDRLLSL